MKSARRPTVNREPDNLSSYRGGRIVANQWTIRPLCFGEFPEFEKSAFTYLRNAGEKIRAPILADAHGGRRDPAQSRYGRLKASGVPDTRVGRYLVQRITTGAVKGWVAPPSCMVPHSFKFLWSQAS